MAFLKFFSVWLIAALLCAGALFFLTGTSDSLSAGYVAAQTEGAACDDTDSSAAQVSQDECLEGLDRRLQNKAQEIQTDLIYWHAVLALVVFAIGTFFMFQITRADEHAGTEEEFSALRGSWFIYLAAIALVTIIATFLARGLDFFGKWPLQLDPSLAWGLPALVGFIWIVTYALGTKLGTPSKMQPSIPLGG